jgi:hypothetical protein
MGYKMKGIKNFGEGTPLLQKKKDKERNYNPKDSEGRSQNVNAKDYLIEDVSKVQENDKGLYVTGREDGSFSNNSVMDTTYLPRGAQHYSGNEYKKGDWLDETDFEEGDLGTGYDFDKKKIRPSKNKKKKK